MHPLSPCALLTLLTLLPSQTDGGGKAPTGAPDILALVTQAEALHRAGDGEAATRLLRRAEHSVRQQPKGDLRDTLTQTIATILAKTDPERAAYDAAFEKAAGELIRNSQRYRRRKWDQLAERVLLDAARLDPGLADTERQRVGRSGSSTPPASPKRDSKSSKEKSLLERFRPSFTNDWTFEPEEIRSPAKKSGRGSHVVLGQLQVLEDGALSVEVKRPDTPSQAAILFGGRSYDDYFILDLIFYEGTACGLVAYHWKSPNLKELGDTEFSLSADTRADWIRYEVDVQGKRAACYIDGVKRMTVTCDREPLGKIGMHISGISKYDGSVGYRDLQLGKVAPTADSPAAETKSIDSKALLADIQTAETRIKAKDLEAATVLLLDAEATARSVANETLRNSLLGTIRKLHGRADRGHTTFLRARTAAAAPLIATAQVYAEARWFLVAGDILDRAAGLDPERTAATRAAIEQAAAAHTTPAGRPEGSPGRTPPGGPYPAQPPTAARNLDLLLWFEGGEQHRGKTPWQVSTEGLLAPTDRLGPTLLLSSGEVSATADFQIECKAGPAECIPGIAIGFQSIEAHHYLAWHHGADGTTRVQLFRVAGKDTTPVGAATELRFAAPAREGWMTVRIRLTPGRLRCKLGTAPEFAIACDTATMAGKIGVRSDVLTTRQPVRFRNLKLTKD